MRPVSEESARAGYGELVRLLAGTRGRRAGVAGLKLGDPRDPLIGLSLDNAAPVFLDPTQCNLGVFFIVGDRGTGRRFAADMLRARTEWSVPRAHVDVYDRAAGQKAVVDATPGHRLAPPRGAVVIADDFDQLQSSVAAVAGPGASEFPASWVLILRQERPLPGAVARHLRQEEVDWLPRARLPRESGYAEGLLVYFARPVRIPVAVVASTPEYEWLTERHGSACRETGPAPPPADSEGVPA